MLKNHEWHEYAGDPDKFLPILEEEERKTLDDLHQLRRDLRVVRNLSKYKAEQEGRPPNADRSAASNNLQRRTRKQRVLELMAQAPEQLWKVRDVATALDDLNVKSLRVTMEDLTNSGSLHKDENANYWFSAPGSDAQ